MSCHVLRCTTGSVRPVRQRGDGDGAVREQSHLHETATGSVPETEREVEGWLTCNGEVRVKEGLRLRVIINIINMINIINIDARH